MQVMYLVSSIQTRVNGPSFPKSLYSAKTAHSNEKTHVLGVGKVGCVSEPLWDEGSLDLPSELKSY